MDMIKREARNKGQTFIRVYLHSGTKDNPLGNEELAIFCQCDNDTPSIEDVDIKGLVSWVNRNPECIKNQSNESYRLSQQTDSRAVVFLNAREIQSCQNANRIYPQLA
jgi:hypothetical protein